MISAQSAPYPQIVVGLEEPACVIKAPTSGS